MTMNRPYAALAAFALALLLACAAAPAQEEGAGRRARRPPGRGEAALALPPDVAALERLSLILGRPTANAVSASLVAQDETQAYVEYGPASGNYTQRTETVSLRPGTPVSLRLESLPPDAPTYYRLRHRASDSTSFLSGAERSFHTQRPPRPPLRLRGTGRLAPRAQAPVRRRTLRSYLARGRRRPARFLPAAGR